MRAARGGVLGALVGLVLGLVLAARPAGSAERIRIKGSDTMLRLVQLWAEEFMSGHPGVAVEVEGGGSAKGVRALIRGETDLASASRSLRPTEARQLLERQGSLGYATLTARDALSLYLHPDNPVRNLSLEAVAGIFRGEVRRWSEVGGREAQIQVLNRNSASGTHLFFAEHVLRGASYTRRARVLPTTSAIVGAVKSDVDAIGYGGIAYAHGVRPSEIEGVAPTAENVRDGSYPIARYLYLLTAEPPHGPVKAFTDWVLGSAGQRIVAEAGYVALYEPPSER